MVHVTLALSDFMLLLITSGLWIAAGIAACAAVGIGACGGLFALLRRLRRGGR